VDLVRDIGEGRDPVPSFADGLRVQLVLEAVERSAVGGSWQKVGGVMARPVTLFTGQWADLPFEEVARPGGGVGVRRARDRLLGRPLRPVGGRR
jgi:hypothetical protein